MTLLYSVLSCRPRIVMKYKICIQTEDATRRCGSSISSSACARVNNSKREPRTPCHRSQIRAPLLCHVLRAYSYLRLLGSVVRAREANDKASTGRPSKQVNGRRRNETENEILTYSVFILTDRNTQSLLLAQPLTGLMRATLSWSFKLLLVLE